MAGVDDSDGQESKEGQEPLEEEEVALWGVAGDEGLVMLVYEGHHTQKKDVYNLKKVYL